MSATDVTQSVPLPASEEWKCLALGSCRGLFGVATTASVPSTFIRLLTALYLVCGKVACIGISRGRWDWLAAWTSCFVLFGVRSTSLLVRWSSFDAFQDFTMTPRPHVLNKVVLFKFTSMCPSSPDTTHFRVLFPSKSHWNASINSSIHQPFQPSIHRFHRFHPSIHH